MLKKQFVFSGNSSESEEIDGGNRAKKKMRKNKVKSVGRKRKRGVSFVSKPLRLTQVSSKLDRVESHHCLLDSFSFEESPFSKVAKTARNEGLQFVSFDWFGSPSEFNGKNCDSSGCVSHSRSSSDKKSSYRKSSLLSNESSGSPVTPSLISQGAPQSVSVPRKVVQCSLENALTKKSAECLSSEAKCSQFRVSPQQMIEETPAPPLPTPSLYTQIHRGDFRKSRQALFTSTPVTGANLRSAKWQLTCSSLESESMDHFSELFKDILDNSSKDSVESASPLVMTEFSLNDLRSSSGDPSNSVLCAAKEALFRVCRQSCAMDFSSYIADRSPAVLEKIGEGVFSEVFGCLDRQGTRSVWKVQPFEGDLIFNGEEQKKSADILSEIFITSSLSDLRSGEKLMTECFVKALDFKCVRCPFPKVLLDCWKEYDDKKELEFAGVALEDFVFASAPQALSVFTQVAYALAIAELALEFEHRDLHWGNIMVSNTHEKDVTYIVDGKKTTFSTRGVSAKIVDFTLSRATIDGRFHYADLATSPEIFESTGEYQFEVYRLMKQHTNNEWETFNPYTNVLWLHYLILQMCKAVRYRNKKAKIHRTYMKKMIDIESKILEFSRASQYVSEQEYYP